MSLTAQLTTFGGVAFVFLVVTSLLAAYLNRRDQREAVQPHADGEDQQ